MSVRQILRDRIKKHEANGLAAKEAKNQPGMMDALIRKMECVQILKQLKK